MHIINDMSKKVQGFASDNATTLLTAGGVVGVVATGVFAGRAGYKAAQIIEERERARLVIPNGEPSDDDYIERENPLTKTEKFIAVGPQFIPPVITGAASITAIIFANRMSANKAAALAAAYGLSQKQFEEYREKVEERLNGPKKDRPDADELETELAQERANRAKGAGNFVIVEGGDVLCFDESNGRYFKSSMDKLQKAENKVNEEIIHAFYCSANEFYDQLGLPPTTWGDQVGWNSDEMLELSIKAILSPEDEKTPCLSVDFRTKPKVDYGRKHH